jgi:hypothetical protein
MMLTMLTAQDVEDALFAQNVRRQAATDETTPEAIIRDEFANMPREAQAQIARLARGDELLKNYTVLMSDRSVVGGRLTAEQQARVVSPVIRVESGHIAGNVAYRSIALAQR